MAEGGAAWRVGIVWEELASRQDQLARIAAVCGTAPVIWREGEPAPDVEALIVGALPEAVPAQTPHLVFCQLASAGAERLPEHPIWRSDVILATAAGVHGVQIGEHVLMLLLALSRDLPAYRDAQRRHLWRHNLVGDNGVSLAPRGLYGGTLGLFGYGHIGRGVAHLARAAGMRVLATAASVSVAAPLEIAGVTPFVDVPAVPAPSLEPDLLLPTAEWEDSLSAMDAVVICAPFTAQTAGWFSAERLGRLKAGAYVVNIARGKIVEEGALIRALREGHLGGAGLDVTDEEPLPANSPLWELPNVIVTPHISGWSAQYAERVVNIFVANLERVRRGEPPLTVVERQRGY